jgi:hypothetical protein
MFSGCGGAMKDGTERKVNQLVNRTCSKVREMVPKAVDLAGDQFSGTVTVKIHMNCGGVDKPPQVALEF